MRMRKSGQKEKAIPLPGQRILRTVAAMAVCLLIYELRGRRGLPLYALLAALMCIQPYTSSMLDTGRRRIIGTVIGIAWGLAALLLERLFSGTGFTADFLHYLIIAVGTGMVLYFTVLLKTPENAQFSAVVFLVVVVGHTDDGSVFLYAYHRLIDTLIGVAVGEFVNCLHLPRIRDRETLFATGITNTLFEEGKTISSHAVIELNRMIDDGCLFTVDTIETPASIRELLPGVHFRVPVVTMDGAVLYDMDSRQFLKTSFLSPEAVDQISLVLDRSGIGYFASTLEHQVLIIRHAEGMNGPIRQVYEKARKSPYRNFAPRGGMASYRDNTIYFFLLDERSRVEETLAQLSGTADTDLFRVVTDPEKSTEERLCVRIFPKASSKEAMLEELRALAGAKRVLTFGSFPERYDIYVENADHDTVVRQLKQRFEPVSIKGWRRMLR